jgi:hypothetical protein
LLAAAPLAAVLDVPLAGVVFDVAVFAFLWCFLTCVVGAEVVEFVVLVEFAGALALWAIRAAPEIVRAIMSFFMVFLLGGSYRGLHTYGRPTTREGS